MTAPTPRCDVHGIARCTICTPAPWVPAVVRYGTNVVHVHKPVAPLSAADIRTLAAALNDLGVPDTALIEVRTPLAPRDRRMVELAVWATSGYEGNTNA